MMGTTRSDIAVDEVVGDDLVPGAPFRGTPSEWARHHLRQLLIVGSFFGMIAFFWIDSGSLYASSVNVENLINGIPVLAMMAIAVTVVLVLGEFDLSVPNVASLVCVVVAILATQTGLGVIPVLIVGVVLAITAGTANGVAVGAGKAPAFVVTLAVGSICAGIELLVVSKIALGQTSIGLATLPASLQDLSLHHVFGFQITVVVLVLISIAVGLVMVVTPWGRHVQAIGGSEVAARLAGVPVRRTKIVAFALTGLLAGVAGILFASGSGYYADALPPFLLPAYAAAFFGAAAVGRRGFSVPATMFGALYLSVLANGLSVLNISTWVTSVVQGIVLFVAVLLARGGSRA